MKTFHLDVQGPARPIERYWEHCVGSCHAATALREDYRAQLLKCHRELGFRYVRFHGLFDDDMSVVKKSRHGDELVLSFTNIDSVFDFLLSIGMKPFVEIGFMPECLKSGEDTVFHFKGNITPPRDYGLWAWLVRSFARHLIERYGRDEVRQWFFEVWNEPNLGGMSGVGGFWAADMEEYFRLYRVTAEAIKAVDPMLPVGGPASSNNAWIPEMLAFCRENSVPIDFISTHHYPTDVVLGYGVEDSLNFAERFKAVDKSDEQAVRALKDEAAVFYKTLWKKVERGVVTEMTRRAVAEADGLPVYYTEWNSLAGIPSDGPFGASFIAKTIMDNMGLVKGYSYWTFTDIFEEGGMPSAAFHGGFGLLTMAGIPKATYRAFQLLHRLGDEQYDAKLSEGTVDAYAMRKRTSRAVQALLCNHQSLLHDVAGETVRVALSGLPDGAMEAEILRVDDTHANAFAAWEAMGRPEYLTEAQAYALKAASAFERETCEVTARDGRAELTLTLPPMGIALVTLFLNA